MIYYGSVKPIVNHTGTPNQIGKLFPQIFITQIHMIIECSKLYWRKQLNASIVSIIFEVNIHKQR